MAFSVVHGMKNPLYHMILEKKLARSPLLAHPVFFSPVKYVAEIIIQAEKKRSEGDADISAMSLKAVGYWLTVKEFHVFPEWELELKQLPLTALKKLAYINWFMAKVLGWAPVGADLCPAVCSFLEVVEEKVDNSTV